MQFDVEEIRKDFPILDRKVNGKNLVYLDNAATSQKPKEVIDSIRDYYMNHNANVHRGVHLLSVEATDAYENARIQISDLINCSDSSSIIWTRNATESINLVASATLVEATGTIVCMIDAYRALASSCPFGWSDPMTLGMVAVLKSLLFGSSRSGE